MVKCKYCGEEIVHDFSVTGDDFPLEEYVNEAIYDHESECEFHELYWIKAWVGGQKTLAEQIESLESVVDALKQHQADGWELTCETDNGYIFVGRLLPENVTGQ